VLYLAANRHPRRRVQPIAHALTVDVLVTVYDEDADLVERCLCAARDMAGEHQTWLLDDGARAELQTLAQLLGVGYLTRKGNLHHKAGNINAALARTSGDIVVIFDVDHVPAANFLERTLGHFNDPQTGFVQVMLTFAYGKESHTGKAASESSLDFYNPASRGADALGAATLIGSNALIRRTALDSIGGYQPGLAEDLATSIALHAAGWCSVYVNEPLAPGLAPPDLKAWFEQQFKWARGVFELLVTKYFYYWPDLTAGQRLSYAVRMTYYWIGLTTLAHTFLPIFLLFWGTDMQISGFNRYLMHLVPLLLATVAIRGVALRHHASASVKVFFETPVYLQWKPLLLVVGTWPAYSLAWLLAIFRVPTRFRPTPKTATGHGPNPIWILPQLVVTILLIIGIIFRATGDSPGEHWLLMSFAAAVALSQTWVLALSLMESVGLSSPSLGNQAPQNS
jgi:cellulose synthase (UDP-forming)